MTSIVVITAGVSQPSATRLLADRLAAATVSAFVERGVEISIEVVELREFARDLANNVVTGFPSTRLAEVLQKVTDADGLIAVSPIYSGSYSGLFKMFVDLLDPDALEGKAVLIAATAGTARHSLALEHAMRPLFSYLRTIVVPTGVFAAAEDWATGADLGARLKRAAAELAQLVQLRSAAAEAPHGPSGADVIPFERLLAGFTDQARG